MSALGSLIRTEDDELNTPVQVSEQQDYANQLAQEKYIEDNDMSFGEMFSTVMDLDWVSSAATRMYDESSYPVDPDYRLPEGQGWEELSTGIRTEYLSSFDNATSPEHAMYIRNRILQEQEMEDKLALQGWSGIGTRFLAPEIVGRKS